MSMIKKKKRDNNLKVLRAMKTVLDLMSRLLVTSIAIAAMKKKATVKERTP